MRSPAVRQAVLVSQVLEDVLIQIGRLRRKVDRSNPVAKIEAALVALRSLAESRPSDGEHLPMLDSALATTREARIAFENTDPGPEAEPLHKRMFAAQRALEHVRARTINAIVAVQDQARGMMHRRAVDPMPFRGSDGVPRLQQLRRDPLATGVEMVTPDDWLFDEVEVQHRVVKVGDRLTSDDDAGLDSELDPELGAREADFVGSGPDEIDAAKRLQMLVPIGDNPVMVSGIEGEIAQLERMAAQCLEDIGVLGNLRRVDEGKLYVTEAVERFERRLLCNVDAAVSLGTAFEVASGGGEYSGWAVLDFAITWAKDAVVPDPGRAFARTFLLCSIEGTDTLRAAVLALKQSHPLTYDMHGEAFTLAPNPGIDAAMLSLCNDDDPRICAMAANVLAMRGYGDVSQLLLLLEHSDDKVRLAAARCAAEAGDEQLRQAAIVTLVDFVEREVDDDISLAAIQSLVLLRSSKGLKLARERIRADNEEPGYLQRSTCDRLLEVVAIAGDASDSALLCDAYRGDVGAAMALARHGHTAAIPVLTRALATGGEVLVGAKRRDAAAAALAFITGAVEQPHPHLGLERAPLPVSAHYWESWWKDNHARFDAKIRYRHGHPYSLLQAIDELEFVEAIQHDRALSATELAVIAGMPRVRITNFYTRQQARLREARRIVEDDLASAKPQHPLGTWAGQHLS